MNEPKPIRVALAEMPPMLRDIVKDTLEREPDIVVVGEVGIGAPLRPALQALETDVVIVGTSEPTDFTLPAQLLQGMPLTRVLMLAMSGRSAVMYELRPHRTLLGEVSPRALVDAIRGEAERLAWQRPL